MMPADAIVGHSDQMALASLIPGARLLAYEGIGHAVHCDAPKQSAADLTSFAASHSAA